jgi:hypothetical protein
LSRKAQVQPPAHLSRIPSSAAAQLSTGLNWLKVVSGGRLDKQMIQAIMVHQRQRKTEPAILLAAAVQFLAIGADHEPDQLNRYWHIADQISARERARYMNLNESDLM